MSRIDPEGKNWLLALRTAALVTAGICAFKTGFDPASDFMKYREYKKQSDLLTKQIKSKRQELSNLVSSKDSPQCRDRQAQLIIEIESLQKDLLKVNQQQVDPFQTFTGVAVDAICTAAGMIAGK